MNIHSFLVHLQEVHVITIIMPHNTPNSFNMSPNLILLKKVCI